jgi:hypothetical protein
LTGAVAGLEAAELQLVAASARYQLGQLLGTSAGRDHHNQSVQWMTAQGILRPDRIAAVFAAGFAPASTSSPD